jgi:ATP phosphoribosyltransferase regulatory subunit HisZ
MHTTHPDFVAIKTAVRHLATRLDNEATAAGHWSSLAENRGIPEVAERLRGVVSALEEANVNAEMAIELLFDAQERQTEEAHEPDTGSGLEL